MRMCVALLGCLALGAGSARAQAPLTEADALARLSTDSPRARAIRAEIDVVRSDVAAASRWPNPQVTASREAAAGVTEGYLLVQQPLPITGRRQLQMAGARARVGAAESRAGDYERTLRAELRLAVTEVRELEAREAAWHATVQRLRELDDILAKREAAGDTAGFDRLRAERELLDVETRLGEIRARRAQAQATLAAFFLPLPDPSTLHVAPDLAPALDLPSLDALQATAEQTRGDLQALASDIESANLAGRAASRSALPEPQVVAGMKTVAGARGSVLSLITTIPLFDRAGPERARAAAEGARATAQREALRHEVRAALAGLRQAVVERRAIADRYRTAAVPKAEELRHIAQVSYDAGERGILELLDAYRSLADARLRQVELDAAMRRAEIDLELASALEVRR